MPRDTWKRSEKKRSKDVVGLRILLVITYAIAICWKQEKNVCPIVVIIRTTMETIVKIPKEAWRKDKARAYGLPCLSLDSRIQIRNDH